MRIPGDFAHNRLTRRLLFYIIICSCGLILFSTSLQLYFKYNRGKNSIMTSLTNFENTVLPNISMNLYNIDEEMAINQLKNLIRLPNIVYVEVTEGRGFNDIKIGDKNAVLDISRAFSLRPPLLDDSIKEIGKLTLYASLTEIKNQLWKEAYIAFLTSAIVIGAIAICFFLIFQHTITRHVLKIVEYTKSLNFEKLDQELVLKVKNSDSEKQDELEQLVFAINSMRLRLLDGINERKKVEQSLYLANVQLEDHREHLEEMVKDRTIKLESSSKQLTAANQELKDFAYIVSHDLKAPLRGIHQLGSWLSQDYKEKLDEKGIELIGLLTSRIERMDNLIDGILQYSRIGRTVDNPKTIKLDNLVRDIISYLAPPEHIKISIKNKLPDFFGNVTHIQQVFQNLISNAIKFMDKPDGSIQLTCQQEKNFWNFAVEDNGPGIEEKYYEKIFQIFQTLNPRDDHESTGIGLTIVKKIIEQYGGTLLVESIPGAGSTFMFKLPVRGAYDEK